MEIHPWNRSFDWPPRRDPPVWLQPEQRERFDRDGFTVLADAVPPDTLARVVAALDPQEQRAEEALLRNGGRAFIAEAGSITFTYNPAARSPELRRFVAGEPFRGACRDLIGPDVRLFWDQAVYKKTERPKVFPCHQDNGYGFVEPQAYLTCWIALVDVDERNGCPRVFPGLHRRGTLRHRLERDGFTLPLAWEEARPVPLRAGSVLLLSSLTPHATGPNLGDDTRKAYIVQFTREDAVYLRGDPERGAPTHREAVRDLPAERQWQILRGGEPVAQDSDAG